MKKFHVKIEYDVEFVTGYTAEIYKAELKDVMNNRCLVLLPLTADVVVTDVQT